MTTTASRTNRRRQLLPGTITLRNAADRLDLSYRRVRELVADGELAAVVVGRRTDGIPVWATTPEAVDDLIARRKAGNR